MPKRSSKLGLSPGTPVYIGRPRTHPCTISRMTYSEHHVDERRIEVVDETLLAAKPGEKVWINVDGVHDIKLVERIGAILNLHPLALEDIVNTQQRPKHEDYGDYIFLVLRMLFSDDNNGVGIETEQVSFIIGPHYVISFQEEEQKDVFDKIRDRIRSCKGRAQKLGADYLAYALIDAVVDSYFGVLEHVGERIEQVEETVTTFPEPRMLREIQALKRSTLALRRSVWPLREMVASLARDDSPLIRKATALFLRDVYDHVVELIDILEAQRDMSGTLLEIYLSSLSNRLNQAMMLLAMIATVFMPLSFIAGVYGMNFDHMPELKWHYGYPLVLLVMALVGGALVYFFRRRNWL